jgi:hypothetical protein
VTERRQRPVVGKSRETAEPPPRDVLEEHALDGILRTERQDLVEGRLEPIGHGLNRVTG